MPIKLICSTCGKQLAAKDTAAGKRVKCPSCGQILLVSDKPKGPPQVSEGKQSNAIRDDFQALWRDHPALRGSFHPDCPDDLKVMFLGSNGIEIMWVTVNGVNIAGTTVLSFRGTLLNEPRTLTNIRMRDSVSFKVIPNAPYPVVLLDDVPQPDVNMLWGLKAMSLRLQKRFAEALACYDRMIQFDGKNAETWYLRGALLGTLQRFKDALDSFGRAQRLGHPRAAMGIEMCRKQME